MKTDRATKLLLAALVVGVWGLLLKPTVLPAQAQLPSFAAFTPALALGNDGVYVAVPHGQSGNIYWFKKDLGKPVLAGTFR